MRSFALCALFIAASPAFASTVAVDPLARGTWLIDQEWDEVALISSTGEVLRVPVGAWPEQLAVAADGTVFVSCRSAGTIAIIDRSLRVSSLEVGAEPRALVIGDGSLYVALVSERALLRIDLGSFEVAGRQTLDFEPWSLAWTGRGIVAGSSQRGVLAFLRPELDGVAQTTTLSWPSISGLMPWRVEVLIPDGDRILAVHSAAAPNGNLWRWGGSGYANGFAQPVQAWVSVLRSTPVLEASRPLGQLNAADVRAAVFRNGRLYAVSRATRSLVSAGIEASGRMTPSSTTVLGDGLSGLALFGDRVLVFAGFDRHLYEVTAELKSRRRATLGAGVLDPELALGRRLFFTFDRRIARGGMSCSACHPDGREDGIVWSFSGSPRQTPLLAGRLAHTEPFDWLGGSRDLETNVAETIKRLHGRGLDEASVRALARFLREGLRAPVLPERGDVELIARGKELFHSDAVACARCHPSDDHYTDGARWDAGASSPFEGRRFSVSLRAVTSAPLEFNTPSLRFVALTAPYFHNGSAPTLEFLLDHNGDRMGTTSILDASERAALVAYLRTL